MIAAIAPAALVTSLITGHILLSPSSGLFLVSGALLSVLIRSQFHNGCPRDRPSRYLRDGMGHGPCKTGRFTHQCWRNLGLNDLRHAHCSVRVRSSEGQIGRLRPAHSRLIYCSHLLMSSCRLLPHLVRLQVTSEYAERHISMRACNALYSAMPGVSRGMGRKRRIVRSGAGCHVGGEDVVRLAIEVLAGPVIPQLRCVDRRGGRRSGRPPGPRQRPAWS